MLFTKKKKKKTCLNFQTISTTSAISLQSPSSPDLTFVMLDDIQF